MNWETVGPEAVALLRRLNSYFDFEVELEPGECGFKDVTGINAEFSAAASFLRDLDWVEELERQEGRDQ